MKTTRFEHHAPRLVWLAYLLIILVGCSNTRASFSCQEKDEFAYVGEDHNVYLYKLCDSSFTQLTNDAPPDSFGLPAYHFYNSFSAWSPKGEFLITEIGQTALAINVTDQSRYILGVANYATWSPSGKYIAVFAEGTYSGQVVDGHISLINMAGETKSIVLSGNAPTWLDDTHLIFWTGTRQAESHSLMQQAQVYKLNSDTPLADKLILLPARIRTAISAPNFAESSRLSSDESMLAIYNPGLEGLRTVTVISLDKGEIVTAALPIISDETPIYIEEWKISGSHSYQWSPTQPVLALCTWEGGNESLFNAFFGNALFLITKDQTLVIKDSKCSGLSQISWNPTGTQLAYWNNLGGLSIINSSGNLLSESNGIQVKGGAAINIENGPWWSPDGSFIGVVADGRICIAEVENELDLLDFECVVEGSEMAWHP